MMGEGVEGVRDGECTDDEDFIAKLRARKWFSHTSGWGLASSAGDINNDGYADIVIGTPIL